MTYELDDPNFVELVRRMGTLLIQRKDVKAFQTRKGEWYPSREKGTSGKYDGPFIKMKMSDFRNHLNGKQTMGHYLVDTDGMTKIFAFDIDLNDVPYEHHDFGTVTPRLAFLAPGGTNEIKDYLRTYLRGAAEGIARHIWRVYEIPVIVAYSGGKGLHVYALAALANGGESVNAQSAMDVAHAVMDSLGFVNSKGKHFWQNPNYAEVLTVETFPKQATVAADGLGNLMALPLGINAKTGQSKFFCDLTCGVGRPGWLVANPMTALSGTTLPWHPSADERPYVPLPDEIKGYYVTDDDTDPVDAGAEPVPAPTTAEPPTEQEAQPDPEPPKPPKASSDSGRKRGRRKPDPVGDDGGFTLGIVEI